MHGLFSVRASSESFQSCRGCNLYFPQVGQLYRQNIPGFHEPQGSIRFRLKQHDAERCQELDDEYLIVWQGFEGKPWDYTTEVPQFVRGYCIWACNPFICSSCPRGLPTYPKRSAAGWSSRLPHEKGAPDGFSSAPPCGCRRPMREGLA